MCTEFQEGDEMCGEFIALMDGTAESELRKAVRWSVLFILCVLLFIVGYAFTDNTDQYTCSTDTECVQQCLAKCQSIEACDLCLDVLSNDNGSIIIDENNYDLYERRFDELLYRDYAY